MSKPYTEKVYEKHGTSEEYLIREFDAELEDRELIWHRDEDTRRVTVLGGSNWKLQLDNQLPEELKIGKKYSIPKLVYHRVIKGEGNLVVKIENI